jgi:hypothetical protein
MDIPLELPPEPFPNSGILETPFLNARGLGTGVSKPL